MEHFTVKPEHLKLLASAYVRWEDCETGAPAIDCKRPYGNSYVLGDIADILAISLDDVAERGDELMQLHRETETVLQLVLSAQSFDVLGQYQRERAWHPWHKI